MAQAQAANDLKLGPIGNRVIFENDYVRVWELAVEPGKSKGLHRHDLPYVIVPLTEGKNVIDPATENKITSVASATVEDAKTAVDAASDAFAGWAGKKPRERAEVLRKAYELIMRDAERFAKLITIENGKALSDSRGEVAYAAEFFRWFAEEAVRNLGSTSVAPASGANIYVHHKPAGVGVLVTPWNFPAAMATRKIGPALAA